jgi:hypothetical protein
MDTREAVVLFTIEVKACLCSCSPRTRIVHSTPAMDWTFWMDPEYASASCLATPAAAAACSLAVAGRAQGPAHTWCCQPLGAQQGRRGGRCAARPAAPRRGRHRRRAQAPARACRWPSPTRAAGAWRARSCTRRTCAAPTSPTLTCPTPTFSARSPRTPLSGAPRAGGAPEHTCLLQQRSSPAVQGSVASALLADPASAGSAQATATHAGCLQVAGLSTRQPEHHCSGLSRFELMAF